MAYSKNYYVYILTNWNNKVMYIGVTNDLVRRVFEHREKKITGFTDKYNVHKLVYFDVCEDVDSAISREKQLKKWRREKKDQLVAGMNPQWLDLAEELEIF